MQITKLLTSNTVITGTCDGICKVEFILTIISVLSAGIYII